MCAHTMDRYIACCGLDCESCEARLATVRNDEVLRRRVAALWSELNGVAITPEMINCTGCRVAGAKTVFCDSLCPIRQCARGKQVGTCGGCAEKAACKTLAMITESSAEARSNLGL